MPDLVSQPAFAWCSSTQTFTESGNRDKHERTHTGEKREKREKPFECRFDGCHKVSVLTLMAFPSIVGCSPAQGFYRKTDLFDHELEHLFPPPSPPGAQYDGATDSETL